MDEHCVLENNAGQCVLYAPSSIESNGGACMYEGVCIDTYAIWRSCTKLLHGQHPHGEKVKLVQTLAMTYGPLSSMATFHSNSYKVNCGWAIETLVSQSVYKGVREFWRWVVCFNYGKRTTFEILK